MYTDSTFQYGPRVDDNDDQKTIKIMKGSIWEFQNDVLSTGQSSVLSTGTGHVSADLSVS